MVWCVWMRATIPHLFIYIGMNEIIFYKYDGHIDTINKRLETPYNMTGKIHNSIDILHPSITVQYDDTGVFPYNYCYIPDLNRYYFISGVTNDGGKKYILQLDVDVLKTYETEILAANGTVSENDGGEPYISNRTVITDVRPKYEKLTFTTPDLFDSDGTQIMVTIKGN